MVILLLCLLNIWICPEHGYINKSNLQGMAEDVWESGNVVKVSNLGVELDWSSEYDVNNNHNNHYIGTIKVLIMSI